MINNFGEYQINQIIHKGDTFDIYRAENPTEKKFVHLKVLKDEFPDLTDVARLQHEYQLIHHLNSEEIIKTFGIVRHGHQLAMVLEDIHDAMTLHDYCKNNPLDPQEFINLAIQITQGLMNLNENRIIHKNLTPFNMIISTKDKMIKITNFSISTQSEKEGAEIAANHIPNSSLPYISPEQTGWLNTSLDYRTDYYSLGCTFYEMLTGTPPFHAERKADFLKLQISENPPKIQTINPNVPEILCKIIEKLMEKNPENRYQSTYGLFKDLEKCRDLDPKSLISWSFPIAEDDIADKFILPSKLYGREKEISFLKQELTKTIEQNKLGIISVSGFSGVGKTSLIKALEQQVKFNNGIVVEGKTDQYQRELPYHAISHAFSSIIDHVMQSEEKEYWADKLKTVLSDYARVIVEIIPNLKNLIGNSPPLPDLGPKETYNRFLTAVNTFIQVFAKPEHPLVIFMDDMQWATTAAINLLDEIIQRNTNNALILIFSYRSNEVDSANPFINLLSAAKKIAPVGELELMPLKKEDINNIVADALRTHQKACEDLAEEIFERSAGNPFFAGELLANLHDQRYIDFDYNNGKWQWDIKKIRSVKTSDNVVDFMITRLMQLPSITTDLIRKAACIGNRFDSNLLAKVAGCDNQALASNLEPALKAQILVPISHNNSTNPAFSAKLSGNQVETTTIFRFQHDRVQQAAYEMIKESEKPAIHLIIAETLKNSCTNNELEDNVVSIANHFNKAQELIKTASEKMALAELNLKAGIKSINSIAYHTAYDFLKTSVSFLSPNCWENNYPLTWNIYVQFSQSAFLSSEFTAAESSNDVLLKHAKTYLEKAKVHRMRAIQYTIGSRSEDALDACLEGLRALKVKINKKASTFSVLGALLGAKLSQGFKPISSLADLPRMTNPEKIVLLQLLMEMVAPCYVLGFKNLFAVTILRQVSLAIRYGNTIETSYAYSAYGLLLNGVFNQPKPAYEFGKVAIKINELLNDMSLRPRILFLFYSFIFPWHKPTHELYDFFEEIIKIGLQTGDLIYATYATHLCMMLPPKGPLSEYIQLGNKYLDLVRGTKYRVGVMVLEVLEQFLLSLQDRENADYFKLNSESEAKYLEEIKASKYDAMYTVYLIKKVTDCYIFDDYKQALSLLDVTEPTLEAMLSSTIVEEYYVYAALTLAQDYPQADASEKKKIMKRIHQYAKKIKFYAQNCPENFLQHSLLLEALILKLQSKHNKAEHLYQKAIQAAQKNNFIHDEGLICNELAQFYQEIGNENNQKKYIKQAHYAYLTWGAMAKVKQLEEQYHYLKTANAF